MRTFAFLLLAGVLGGACGPAAELADDVDVALSFEPTPHVGDTTCEVRLTGPDGAPVEGATLEVEGNMNHAGMVPVFARPEEFSPGTYQAPFEFTMGGDWFVIVRAELADGRAVEEVLDVPGVPVDGSQGDAPCCQPESR